MALVPLMPWQGMKALSFCLQDRNVNLMFKHAQLETQVFEAHSRESRANASLARVEAETSSTKAHMQWLTEQLDSHRGALQAEKTSSSSQVLSLPLSNCSILGAQSKRAKTVLIIS